MGRTQRARVSTINRMSSAAPASPWWRRRSRLWLALGLAALLGVVAALVVWVGPGSSLRGLGGGAPGTAAPTRGATAPPSANPTGPAPSPGGSPPAGPTVPSGSPSPGPGGGAPTTSVRYAFDAGSTRATADRAGVHSLRVAVAAGGTITFPRRGGGTAVKFPPRCTGVPADCPRAILEGTNADLLNPGTNRFRYGGSVLMSPADTGAGANVVQKGYSTDGGSQYKLQIDGKAGRPSCVLASAKDIYRLIAPVSVADGRWHAVTCTRDGDVLSIAVDGKTYTRRVPATLSIVNEQPLRIGGKGTAPNNDQFAGQIDDVFVAIY